MVLYTREVKTQLQKTRPCSQIQETEKTTYTNMWRIKGDHKKVKHFIKEMKHLSTEEDAAY